MNVQELLNELVAWAIVFGRKLLASLLVLIVGRILIKWYLP